MKKILSLLLSMTLVFSLAACSGGGATSSDGGTSEPSSQTPSESEAPSNSETLEESAEPTEETGGTLIAYFSWSGNTEQMAQMIQTETGGD